MKRELRIKVRPPPPPPPPPLATEQLVTDLGIGLDWIGLDCSRIGGSHLPLVPGWIQLLLLLLLLVVVVM